MGGPAAGADPAHGRLPGRPNPAPGDRRLPGAPWQVSRGSPSSSIWAAGLAGCCDILRLAQRGFGSNIACLTASGDAQSAEQHIWGPLPVQPPPENLACEDTLLLTAARAGSLTWSLRCLFRLPTAEEMAAETGFRLRTVERLRRCARLWEVSLDGPAPKSGSFAVGVRPTGYNCKLCSPCCRERVSRNAGTTWWCNGGNCVGAATSMRMSAYCPAAPHP